MAFDTAILENPRTGQIRTSPVGFSWTMFLFGPFAPMFRGDWKWAIIVLILALITAVISVGFLGWVPGVIGAAVEHGERAGKAGKQFKHPPAN